MQQHKTITEKDKKEQELAQSAAGIVASLLSKGPKLYSLQLDLAVLRNIVWEMRTQRYIKDIENCLTNLTTDLLTAIDTQVEELILKEQETKIAKEQKIKKTSQKKANLM